MNRKLQRILQKVESVQLGLLRLNDEEQRISIPARAGRVENELNCVFKSEGDRLSLLSRQVNLIQKDKDDYLYISCRVKDEVVKNSATVISMEVLKACWFTRKSKGNSSWLKEKYMYEAMDDKIDLAS